MVAGQKEHRHRGRPEDVDRPTPGPTVDEVVVEDIAGDDNRVAGPRHGKVEYPFDDGETGLLVPGAGLLPEEPALHAELPVRGVEDPDGMW